MTRGNLRNTVYILIPLATIFERARLQALLVGLALPLMLGSCSAVRPYPDNWDELEKSSAPNQCPILSGMYEESGDAADGCHAWLAKCRSLSWNLLAGHMSYGEFHSESTYPESPYGSHVELRQVGEDQLDIILWDIYGQERRVVREETLSAKGNDFSCGPDGLTLSPRALVVVYGISNVVATYTRTFNRNDNGYLVLKSSEVVVGHHTFLPMVFDSVLWVRWSPFE